MLRLLRFLFLHFASKQLAVSEKFCFHTRHHKEGGRLWHRVSPVNSEAFQMVFSLTAWLEEGIKVKSHCSNTQITAMWASELWKRIPVLLLKPWLCADPQKLVGNSGLFCRVSGAGEYVQCFVPLSSQKAERVLSAEKHPCYSDASSSKTKQ